MSAADKSGVVYFLLHLPKTAGQTIQYHLAEHGRAESVWLPRLASWPLRLLGRRHHPSDIRDLRQVRAVTGHEIGCSLERHFAGREIRRVVLLREPLDLQLSLYNYRMMNHLNKGLGTYSFALHLKSQPRNFMAHWLLARWLEIPSLRLTAMAESDKYDLLNRVLAGFWFVADHRACDRLIAAIAADLEVPAAAKRRNTAQQWHRQINWDPLTKAALSPALIDAVRRQNPLDQALWESWRDANFGTSDVLPQPLAGLGRMGGLIHEARRPLMAVGRTALRQRPTWLRAARPQRGLRSGVYQADRARDAGKWQLAARLYRRALAEDPSLAAIWAQYGHMLWMLGDVAGTERAYREALRRAPVDADTRAQVDQGLRLIGWSDEAADAVRQAVMRCPKRGVAAAQTLLNR